LTRGDLNLDTGPHVLCHGKGRKDRTTPLTAETVAVLRTWASSAASIFTMGVLIEVGERDPSQRCGYLLMLSVGRGATAVPGSCWAVAGEGTWAVDGAVGTAVFRGGVLTCPDGGAGFRGGVLTCPDGGAGFRGGVLACPDGGAGAAWVGGVAVGSGGNVVRVARGGVLACPDGGVVYVRRVGAAVVCSGGAGACVVCGGGGVACCSGGGVDGVAWGGGVGAVVACTGAKAVSAGGADAGVDNGAGAAGAANGAGATFVAGAAVAAGGAGGAGVVATVGVGGVEVDRTNPVSTIAAAAAAAIGNHRRRGWRCGVRIRG